MTAKKPSPTSATEPQAARIQETETVPPNAPNPPLAPTQPESGSAVSIPSQLPFQLGRYKLLKLLGRGGMGAVYLAEHEIMERRVALKVISRDIANKPELIERFHREIKAVAKLTHPNIVAAHDAEQIGETHLLVMEYVDGTDLSTLLAERGRLPIADACDYMRQAALGLQHAFEQGLVHRDIKPHNLMVEKVHGGQSTVVPKAKELGRTTYHGPLATTRVKILDFGLARVARAAAENAPSGITASGVIMGTPDYMAPEQTSSAHEVDIRADIYSLGCTLYHLLSGRVPFPGGTVIDKLMRHNNERPEPLEQVRPEVTPELAKIVRKMMAKDPARRYQTPFEVAEALAPFADPGAALIAADAEEIAEAAARAEAAKLRGKLIWASFGLAGFVAIAAIVGVLYIVLKQFELQTPPNEAPAGTPPVRRGAVGQPPGRFTMGIRELHRLDGHTGPVLALALSKDAKQLLSSGNDGTVRLWDLKEYKEVRQFQGHKDAVFAVAWSPDGRFAFSAGGGRLDAKLLPQTGAGDFAIRMWEVATGKEVRRFEGHTAFVEGLVCSADGQSILSGSNDGSIRLWETATGKETRQFVGHKGAVKRLSLSADGRFALSAGVDHTARIWEMPSGRLVHTLTTDLSLILGGVFRPDGKEVMLYSFLDGALRVWNVETGKEVRRIKTQDTGVLAAAFNASGDTAFSGGVAGTLQVWFPDTGAEGVKGQTGQGQILGLAVTEDAAIAAGGDGSIRFFMPDVPKMPNNPFSGGNPFGDLTKPGSTLREVRQFVGHDGPILAVAISPSGKYALSAGNDKTIRLWNIANGKEIRQFTGHEGPVACVAFSPDGQQALSGSADKTMRLWDVGTGEEIRQFRGHTEIIPGLAFLPDGKAVSASDDQTFRIWDLATGETIRKFEEPPGQGSRIGRIAVSADGKQMAAGGRGHALRLWDLETGQLIKTTVVPHTGPVAAVAYYEGPLFSTDDHFHMIVSGARNDTTLRAWMTTPREMASIFVNHNPVGLESVAVSVAGKKAIAGGSDGALSVCDVMFGREKGHSTAHTAGVMGVAFTPDGKQAISVSMDGTMRLWEIPN